VAILLDETVAILQIIERFKNEIFQMYLYALAISENTIGPPIFLH
jgi:hypothetical protein